MVSVSSYCLLLQTSHFSSPSFSSPPSFSLPSPLPLPLLLLLYLLLKLWLISIFYLLFYLKTISTVQLFPFYSPSLLFSIFLYIITYLLTWFPVSVFFYFILTTTVLSHPIHFHHTMASYLSLLSLLTTTQLKSTNISSIQIKSNQIKWTFAY